MKNALLICMAFLAVLILYAPVPAAAQGNIDWEELWVNMQPSSNQGTFGWMAGQRQYTGLAYDKIRDNLYIVNPAICTTGGVTVGCPKIHIWDPTTGLPKTTEGRGAIGVLGVTAGAGGQLPVPPDTIAGVLTWVWPGSYNSFSQGQFPIYKVRLDDEVPPRIFACNLVSPIWGICFPGPPPNCDPIYLGQGPVRIWRWDTPKSSPQLTYVTLNAANNAPGTLGDAEMAYTRWGDAFDVVGKRGWVETPDGQKLVDSVRIFISGGAFSGQDKTTGETNRRISVLLTDSRPSPVINGNGIRLDYRLGIEMVSSLEGIASHGIAATGPQSYAEVWMDNNARVTTLNNQFQTSAPFPQICNMTRNHSLSMDEITGTGWSGPIRFFSIQENGNKFLVCADGFPSNPTVPTDPNTRTRARIMNVTQTGNEYREPGFGDTPYLGQKSLQPNSGQYNYIADVDVKLEGDPAGKGYFVTLFVLMSGNGIAAYRSRIPMIPVEITTFRAVNEGAAVDLTWEVTHEVNNYGFAIERSFNGGSTWEKIGFVAGRGNSTSAMTYSYSDPVTETHRAVGTVVYRLRQIDTDGKNVISPTVNVFFGDTPNAIELSQNYPNPFNPSTSIGYQLTAPGFVTLKVFNQVGEEVRTLVNETKDAGTYIATFKGDDLPSGTYVYQLNVDGKILQKKMVLMK